MATDPLGRPITHDPHEVWAEIMEITPNISHTFLAMNTRNRNLRPGRVDMWCGILERGEAVLNAETIKIGYDPQGNQILQDGQHRLHAIVKTGISAKFLVAWNLPAEAQSTTDIGDKRSFGDELKMNGEKNHARLAGAVAILYAYVETGAMDIRRLNPTPTPQQKLEFFYGEHPALRNYIHPPYTQTVTALLTPSLASALYYLFSQTDSDDAQLFFDILGGGTVTHEKDPVRVLRERLLKEERKNRERMHVVTKAAYAIKAFNLWRDGVEVQALRWSGGGAAPEPFPRVRDCAIVPKERKVGRR